MYYLFKVLLELWRTMQSLKVSLFQHIGIYVRISKIEEKVKKY